MKLKAKSYKLKAIQGFTALEILIVVSIIALVSTLIIIPFASFRNNQLLKGAAEEVVALLATARSKTLASEADSQYGVHFTPSNMVLFKGSTYNSADPTNQVVNFHNLISLSDISLTAGAVDVVFRRLTGKATVNGTLTVSLQSDSAENRVITIYSTGLASLN